MEELLIAVAASQDREAFHSLFNYFAPRVKSYLQQKGTSPELAEEAVQEAMLNVWRKAGQFDPQKASASTWADRRDAESARARSASTPAT